MSKALTNNVPISKVPTKKVVAIKASHPKDLLKSIKAGSKCPEIVYIFGSDRIRMQRALEALQKALIPASTQHAFVKYNAKDLDAKKLHQLLLSRDTLSLFTSTKMLVVDNIEELNTQLSQELANILEKPSPDTYTILLAKSAPATNPLVKLASQLKSIWQFEQLAGAELTSWIDKELKHKGVVTYPKNIADLLIENAEGDLDKIASQLEILASYANEGKVVQNDIKLLFPEHSQAAEFQYLDELLNRNLATLPVLLHKTLLAGKSSFALIGLLQRSFLNYIAISYLHTQGYSTDKIASSLSIQPWLVKRHLEKIKKIPTHRLKARLMALTKADSQLKNRSLGTEIIFDGL